MQLSLIPQGYSTDGLNFMLLPDHTTMLLEMPCVQAILDLGNEDGSLSPNSTRLAKLLLKIDCNQISASMETSPSPHPLRSSLVH